VGQFIPGRVVQCRYFREQVEAVQVRVAEDFEKVGQA